MEFASFDPEEFFIGDNLFFGNADLIVHNKY